MDQPMMEMAALRVTDVRAAAHRDAGGLRST